MPPYDSQEFLHFREISQNYDKEFNNLHNAVTGAGGKVVYSNVENIPSESIGEMIGEEIEGKYFRN